mgnify:CR=1 FL=1
MSEFEKIYDPKYMLVGEKLVCIADKFSKPKLIDKSSAHRGQQIVAEGSKTSPARCYISRVARIVRDKFKDV